MNFTFLYALIINPRGEKVNIFFNISLGIFYPFSVSFEKTVFFLPSYLKKAIIYYIMKKLLLHDRASGLREQFLYQLMMEEDDAEAALENFRQGLMLINSQENYDELLHSGFKVLLRDENRTQEETLSMAAKHFGLE